MIAGVNKKEEKIIKNILKPYNKDYNFYYYGSRVKGNYTKLSDLDILIKGEKEFTDLTSLKFQIDNSYLPYIVNFTDFQYIDENFYKLIKNDLVSIFSS